jgi:hypothetical protein
MHQIVLLRSCISSFILRRYVNLRKCITFVKNGSIISRLSLNKIQKIFFFNSLISHLCCLLDNRICFTLSITSLRFSFSLSCIDLWLKEIIQEYELFFLIFLWCCFHHRIFKRWWTLIILDSCIIDLRCTKIFIYCVCTCCCRTF